MGSRLMKQLSGSAMETKSISRCKGLSISRRTSRSYRDTLRHSKRSRISCSYRQKAEGHTCPRHLTRRWLSSDFNSNEKESLKKLTINWQRLKKLLSKVTNVKSFVSRFVTCSPVLSKIITR